MPCKVPRNSSRQAGSRTKFVVPNPSHDSTLGDVGYRDQKGSWRKIVNLLDTESCELLGIKSLRLARGSPQYVSQAPHAPLGQPFVYTDPGASHRLLSPDELARTNYRELLDINREGWGTRDRPLNRILLLFPKPNTTTTVFVGGPKIFVRTLHLPESILRAWLDAYRSKIRKFAMKLIDLFPPNGETALMCLCLRELFTEAWRTAYIRAEGDAAPVALGLRASEEAAGEWINLETPKSTSLIGGGFASNLDGTEWTFGGEGIPFEFPPKINLKWFIGCFVHPTEGDLDQPIPLPIITAENAVNLDLDDKHGH